MEWSAWEAQLDAARDDAEVIALARDFLRSLEPMEVAQLPARCRPPRLAIANDVHAYARDLLRTRAPEGEAAWRGCFFLISAFFAHASDCLARLQTLADEA